MPAVPSAVVGRAGSFYAGIIRGQEVKKMANENTVTIPLDEYFDLRQKAEINSYLMNELGRMEGRFQGIERVVFELENTVRRMKDAK